MSIIKKIKLFERNYYLKFIEELLMCLIFFLVFGISGVSLFISSY